MLILYVPSFPFSGGSLPLGFGLGTVANNSHFLYNDSACRGALDFLPPFLPLESRSPPAARVFVVLLSS